MCLRITDCFVTRVNATHTASITRSQVTLSLALPPANNRYGLYALSFLGADRLCSYLLHAIRLPLIYTKTYRVPRKKALGLWECPIQNLLNNNNNNKKKAVMIHDDDDTCNC